MRAFRHPRVPLKPLTTALAAVLLAAVPATSARAHGSGHSHGRDVPLRVATYNIAAGAGADATFDLARTTEAIRALHADVVGLQEVDVHWGGRSQWRDEAREIADALGMHVFFGPIYRLDPPAAGDPPREFGVAVLSRHRILHAENHEITRLSTQVPNPVPEPAPGFPEVVVNVRGVPVHVYATHLDYRPDPAVRQLQVADTRRIMAEDCHGKAHARHCPPQILVGDFNAPADAPELAPLWNGLTDAWTASGKTGPGYTYPAAAPAKRIDLVTYSKSVRARQVTVADTLASDHRPVVADLRVRR